MAIAPFIPNGFVGLKEVLRVSEEAELQANPTGDAHEHRLSAWMALRDDFANGKRPTSVVTSYGSIEPIPLRVWRQEESAILRIFATGRASFSAGVGYNLVTISGRVIVGSQSKPDMDSAVLPNAVQRARNQPIEEQVLRENRIRKVLLVAKERFPNPQKRPPLRAMAEELCKPQYELGFKEPTIRQILNGTYATSKRLKIRGLDG